MHQQRMAPSLGVSVNPYGTVPHQRPKPAWRRPSSSGSNGSSAGVGAVAAAPRGANTTAVDEVQRAALVEHMRRNGLKVADVLRLCAAIVDDSERPERI